MRKPTGYVLCGGRSERMKYPKALLRWKNTYFADHIAQQLYEGGCTNVFLVGKECFLHHCTTPYIQDTISKYHPLSGILTALQHSNTEQICIAPCDIPTITSDDVNLLVKSTPITYHPQNPLLCLLHRNHISRVRTYLSEDNSIYDFVSIGNELHNISSETKLPNYNYPEDFIMDKKEEDHKTKGDQGLNVKHFSSSGWKHQVSSLNAKVIEDSWPKISASLSNIPPVKQILESAGRSRYLSFQDGQFSIYGYPDLIRDSSKVLAVRHIGGLPEVVALHRFPAFVAFGIREDSPKCLHKYVNATQDTYNKYQVHLLSLDFSLAQAVGIEGENILFSRNNEIFRYRPSKNALGKVESLGTIAQALSTLFLHWSQQ